MTALHRITGFLGAQTCADLLRFAVTVQQGFRPSAVDENTEPNLRVRRSFCTPDIGEFQPVIERRIRDVVPSLIRELRIAPFEPAGVQLEMVAHGDGGFYKRHVDTFTGATRSESGDRVISCVYYFFRQPKAFSGGQLRLFPPRTTANPTPQSVELPVENDSLVAFSSWMAHEVLPVSRPTPAFEDSRFSINCWVYRAPSKRR